MKTDIGGVSQCAKGREQYEIYFNRKGEERVQYDYRTESGLLFSACFRSLEQARIARDRWLKDQRG